MMQSKEIKKIAGSPMVITDMENVDGSGLTVQNYGYPDGIFFSVRSISPFEVKCIFYVDSFQYVDGLNEVSGGIRIYVGRLDAPLIDLHEGDYITLTYDGSQTLDVYFPLYQSADNKYFYIATTGETYYDFALTQDACTYANGCRVELVYDYPYFTEQKDIYLNGGDFNTFITDANQWVIA